MQKIIGLVSSSLSNLKKIDKQTRFDVFWVGIIQAANYLFPFLATTYLIRTIGVVSYGKTEFATYVVLYFITAVNYELHVSGTRTFSRIKHSPARVDRLFNTIFAAKTYLLAASTLLFILLVLLWSSRFNNTLFFFTYLIVFGHYFYQPHIFQGLGKIRVLAIMNFLIKAISTGLLFLIVRSKDDYDLVNLNYSLSYCLIGFASFLMALKLFHIRFRWKSWRAVKTLFKNGFYIFFTNGIIAQVTLNLSAILLGFFLPPDVLGSYSAALKIIVALQVMVLLPIRQVYFPKLSALWTHDKTLYKREYKIYALLMTGSTLVVGILILIFAPAIIRMMYGSYFPKMIFCMRMLAFLPLFTALNNVFISDGLIVIGKDRLVFHFQLAIAILNIIVLLLTVPRYGLSPVLIVRNLLELAACTTGFFFFQRTFKKEWNNWLQDQASIELTH